MGLLDAVDAAWALGLGCQVDLLRVAGAHLVAGGPGMQGYDAIFMVRIDAHSVLRAREHRAHHGRS